MHALRSAVLAAVLWLLTLYLTAGCSERKPAGPPDVQQPQPAFEAPGEAIPEDDSSTAGIPLNSWNQALIRKHVSRVTGVRLT